MQSRRAPHSSRLYPFSTILRQLFAPGWRRRAICLLLICGLLTVPGLGYAVSAASSFAVQIAKDTVAPVPVAVKWVKRLFRPVATLRQETTADRNAYVASIRISPEKIVGYTGQQISFSALGSNADGLTIQGAQFKWGSSDLDKLQINSAGLATFNAPGLVWVTAATTNASTRVPVLIKPGERPLQSDSEWLVEQKQLQPDGRLLPVSGTTGNLLDSVVERLTPTAQAQTGGGDSADFLYDELWSEPRNMLGSPRNSLMSASAIGAVLPEGSNFEFSVPLYGLSGRGVSENIALNYNSRIWSRHGSAVTFNAVNSWPYLGFSLSFGRIVTYASGSNTKFVLIDSDGTRRYLGSGPGGTTTTYQTSDGSHITFVGKASDGGILYYNNGVQKKVEMVNNRLLVTRLLDPNGNYITIAYKSQSSPSCSTGGGFIWKQAIDTITDTLGRVIQFNYDTCNNLVSIDVPGYGGTSSSPVTTTIARFDYLVTSSVSTSFSGLTVENVPSGYPVVQLSHVYMPATNTGYKFTYSAYGMISTVSLRKDMSYNSSTGAISDGNEKAYVSYNYPATASSLTDAPSFSQWTQSPAATSGGTATWSFTSSSGSGTKSFVITNPDSSTLTLTRSDASGTDFGLLTQSEVKTSGGTSMAKSVISYTTDGGGQPQVANIVRYDDATPTANQTKVDNDYDSYGNVTNTREYGFKQSGSWVVRRRTHNVYKTDTSYVNAYLRSLVIERDIYDAQLDTNDSNDVLVAKTTYTYDDYTAMSGMENYSGTIYSVGHLSTYDTTWTVRGNVTGTTEYSDVTAPTTIIHLRKIDIFGNVVKEQLSCCNQQTINTDDTNGYFMPLTVVKGDSSGATLTTTYGSDFNTSLQKSVMDPNSQTTTISSRDAALRVTQIDLPTGGARTTSYDDSTLSISVSGTFDDGGTTKTVTVTTVEDGWDRVIQKVGPNGAQVNTNYDNMGRVASLSNPFTAGGSPSYLTSYSYDALGRSTTTTLPDSQTVTTSYNGNSMTVTDQVNRKTQRLTDGLGRLVTVNEQDASAALTQATDYTYDVLNNLTQVDQGGQLRSYKYDALSRKLYESIPEQTATINDGSGTYWTCKYTYTDFNAVATRTDARGVVSSYSYDTLNRLTQLSYNTVSGVTTAPTVTYTYDTDSTYSTTANGKLVRVNVGSDYQERYTFDTYKRIASTVFTIGTRSYTTSNQYNEANQPKQTGHMYYDYDSLGRLSAIKDSTGASQFYNTSYNLAGQLTADTLKASGLNGGYPVNSVTDETFGYDAARLQMTTQTATTTNTNNGTCLPSCPSPPAGGTNLDLTYTYDTTTSGKFGVGTTAGNAGQLLSVSGTIGGVTESASYTYDNYGRLLTSNQASNGSSAQRRFDYDRWGNRTATYDATSGGNLIENTSLVTSHGIPSNRIEMARSAATNVAAASNGATASASSTYNSSTTPASGAINGDHKGTNWGSGGGWSDNTTNSYPDWLQVNFSSIKTISEVDVFSIQNSYSSPSEPTESMTFSLYGLTDFQVQYWDETSWQTVSGGSISSNNKVWRKVSFPSVRTDKIRIYITGTADGLSRLAEVEAYNISYDANGNVTDDGHHLYTYDSENRLVGVDGGTADYGYDHQNRRYKKTGATTVTHYVWQGGKVLGEYNGSTGATQALYWYAGERLFKKTGTTTQVFLSSQASVRLALSDIGAVAGRQAHLPFGEDFAESGTQDKHHFTSYERDSETATDYAVNRQYSQSIGRFNRPDPCSGSYSLSLPQSLNRYSYVKNDPIGSMDPSGLADFADGSWGWTLAWWSYPNTWLGLGPDYGSPLNSGGYGTNVPTPSLFNLDAFLAALAAILLPGKLTVKGGCEKVIYVPEIGANGRADHDWRDASSANFLSVDFFATPRGLFKVQNGCDCKMSCSDGNDYAVNCICMGLGPLIPYGSVKLINLTNNIGETRPAVADPREVDAYKWVGTGAAYMTKGAEVIPTLGGPPNSASYVFK